MLKDIVQTPEEFLGHSERFAISIMFSAVYGVRLAQLQHPVMKAFYQVWAEMLKCNLGLV